MNERPSFSRALTTRNTGRFLVLILAAFFASFLTASYAASVPQTVNFQGRLTDNVNNPRTGTFSFTFAFYNAPSAGTQLPSGSSWSETQTLTVTNGVFNAVIGSVTPIPASVFASTAAVFLEITVAGETLSPRETLATVPFAFNAQTLTGLTFDAFVDTSTVQTINGVKTFTSFPFKSGVTTPVNPGDLATKAYVDSTSGGGNVILNQNTLQSGSTFYVSSGTVNGQLTARGAIIAGSGNNQITTAAGLLDASKLTNLVSNTSLDASSVTLQGNAFNGASQLVQLDNFSELPVVGGTNVTGLLPANIADGRLGTNVLASSISVNSVYPAAVSAGVYGNVTGVGSQTQALYMSNHQINAVAAPTTATDAATKAYVDAATGTVAGAGILNQNTLQAGSTFYVSSGTVNGQLTARGAIIAGSGNNQITTATGLLDATKLTNLVPNSSIDVSSITKQGNVFNGANGLIQLNASTQLPAVSGVNLTNLTATAISAGTLGANVVASSIAVNAVYPNAVASGIYTNVTGVGAQSQVLNMGSHLISNVTTPSAATDAATKAYVDAATTTVSGNAVLNQNTLQSGATFYVSSGTVNGAFRVGGTITTGSGNNQVTTAAGLLDAAKLTNLVPNTSIDASSVTQQGNTFNGASQLVQLNVSSQLPAVSGANLTTLTASAISAGSLGANVIASSIAVNAVYPNAVTSGAYTNVTGVGSQSQVLNMGNHLISNVTTPAAATDAATKAYVDAATSTVSGNAILNQNTLQSGATFYVSSGTVSGSLRVGAAITAGSGNNQITTAAGLLDAAKLTNLVPNTSIDASSVTQQGNTFNGASQLVQLNVSSQLPAISGANLTALTAAAISAGSLGANVIASSIAVNAVYPTAVASAVYGNVTGVGAQSQALNLSGHQINNVTAPTADSDAATKAYVDAATSTVSGSAILNQNTLQNGATFYVSSGTVASSFSAGGNLYPVGNGIGGQFLQTNGAGVLSWQPVASAAGTPALAVNRDSVQVSSPTSIIRFFGNDFNASLAGGATAMISLNPATTDFIQNTSVLQAGSIFNVSSATVNGQFTARGAIIAGTGNTQITTAAGLLDATKLTNLVPNSSIDVSSITKQGNAFNGTNQLVQLNGSGQLPSLSGVNLTGLTASAISAGSLGANVIASSIAVNAVYPNSVASNAYPNVTGIGTQGQALNMGSHLINNVTTPSAATDAATKAYVDAATATVTGNSIFNQNTLQSGATFYVSSGTVNGQLTAATFVGNGAAITNLTAGNINAGSLGSSVIASSIAASAVYPNAVSSNAYPTITGIGTQGQTLNMNSHSISNVTTPVLANDAATKSYVDLATASINTSALLNSTNTWTAQQIHTAQVSISSNLVVTSGIISGNGSGLTTLTAASISAGSLGVNVIASSVAVNTVYPNAVALNAYPNITGVGTQGQALNMGSHLISNVTTPSAATDAATKAYVDAATGTVTGNSIQNQNTLQSGATFYVSSGTVNGGFRVGGTITTGTGNNQITTAAGLLDATKLINLVPNTSIDGSSVTQQGNTFNGASQLVQLNVSSQLPAVSGANLTTLTASAISAGSLGANVIASSIAVNAVYPNAVASNAYPNITGIGTQGQALNMGSHLISNVTTPSAATDAATKAYVDAATTTVSGNAVLNQNTLQSGATFYVSSGTVNGSFRVGGTLTTGSGNNQITTVAGLLDAAKLTNLVPNTSIDASSVTQQGNTFNGASQLVQLNVSSQLPAVSGANLTTLTASAISAGSLGANVIASSIAVNAVYPSAVASNAYPNITGIGTQGQALNMGSHLINNVTTPSAATDAATKAYVDAATGTVTGNSIQNQNTLQSGATFYVSSGTVNGGFRVGGTITAGTGNNQITTAAGLVDAAKLTNLVPNSSIDGSSVTLQGNAFNGASQLVQLNVSSQLPAVSGANLTTLTASAISAGSLGANVIASSIAVNAVYPNAMASNAYPAITGIGTQGQALNMGSHLINNVTTPSAATDAATKAYVDAATGTVTGNSIQNQNTLQSGATFYVSSGTVNGGFRVGGTITTGTGNNQITTAAGLLDATKLTNLVPNTSIDASSVTQQGNAFNGASQLVQLNVSSQLPAVSGANLTTLTASAISAGSLGANVIASSIAANAVYPNAVSAGAYANVTGVGTQIQALNMNNHLINNVTTPISAADAATKAYVDAATTTVSGSAILNQAALQSGATFHVSSGTVDGQLAVGGSSLLRGAVSISSNVYISSNTVGFDEYNNGSVAGSLTINWNNSNKQVLTLSGNVTSVAFTNPPHACNVVLRVATGSGGFSITGWPGSLKWSGGTTPTITTTAGKNDILAFYFDGNTYYGVDSPNF